MWICNSIVSQTAASERTPRQLFWGRLSPGARTGWRDTRGPDFVRRGGRLCPPQPKVVGAQGADSASDTPRRMSGWWSQCPWGRSSAPTHGCRCRVPSTLPGWVSLPSFGPPGASAPTVVVVTAHHPPGLGGYRYLGGGRFVNRPYGAIIAASVFSFRRAGPACPALPVGGVAEGRGLRRVRRFWRFIVHRSLFDGQIW